MIFGVQVSAVFLRHACHNPPPLISALTAFQALESRGIHIIPYGRLQQYFTSIDLRSAIQDNAAFKLSFGATFALVGFAQL